MGAGTPGTAGTGQRRPESAAGMVCAMKDFYQHSLDVLPMVGVAVMGATLASYKKHLRWRDCLFMQAASGFGAYIFGFAAADFDIPEGVAFFVAGCIGLSGGKLMENFLRRFQDDVGRGGGRGYLQDAGRDTRSGFDAYGKAGGDGYGGTLECPETERPGKADHTRP